MIVKKTIKIKDIKFFIGYSGWGEGQLASELESTSWLVADADYTNIMIDGSSEIWGNELKKWVTNMLVFQNFQTTHI